MTCAEKRAKFGLEQIARYLASQGRIGDLNRALSSADELRFGRHGSLAVVIAGDKAGSWYDHENCIGGNTWSLLREKAGLHDNEIPDWLQRELGIHLGNSGGQRIVATYDYCDETGALLYQVVRLGPKKEFYQRAPDGVGGWRNSLNGVRRILYGLPELIAARHTANGHPPRVYIPEGEKDVDRLIQWGLTATTNPGGAGKWRAEYNPLFAGFEAVIIPDNDQAGRSHAQKVAGALFPIASQVKVLDLEGLPERGDISYWINQGGTQDDLETLVELCPPFAVPRGDAANDGGILIDPLTSILIRPVRWLWPGRIARGKLTLFAGHPGLGKSHIGLDIAARLSIGANWPDNSGPAPIGHTLILSGEDDPEDTLKPRLLAAGADPQYIHVIHAVRDLDARGRPVERGFSIAEDIDRLGELVARLGNVVAIVIDPLTTYLGATDTHKTAEVRGLLRPLVQMAAAYAVAIIGITHLRKNNEGDAMLLVTGSLAFVAAARAVYFVIKDEADQRRRMVMPAKQSLHRYRWLGLYDRTGDRRGH